MKNTKIFLKCKQLVDCGCVLPALVDLYDYLILQDASLFTPKLHLPLFSCGLGAGVALWIKGLSGGQLVANF